MTHECRVCITLWATNLAAFCEKHGDYAMGVRGIRDGVPFPAKGGSGGAGGAGPGSTVVVECGGDQFANIGGGGRGYGNPGHGGVATTGWPGPKWHFRDGQTIEFSHRGTTAFWGKPDRETEDFID